MTFEVNTSPFLGREGKFVTSRQIRERLDREAIHNVALRVEPTGDPDKFVVFGRGELHLGVLLENMRREGYEMAVSRPRVVIKQIDGVAHEPYEQVTVDADADAQGAIMSALGSRGAELKDMQADGPRPDPSGLHGAVAGLDRLPDRISHHDPRHRPAAPRVRSLRPRGAAGTGPAPERGVDRERPGSGAGLLAVQPAGTRPAVHRPRGRGLRGDDHRSEQPRQRPGREPAQGQEIDQHARGGQGRERGSGRRPSASRWSRPWSSSTTTNSSR